MAAALFHTPLPVCRQSVQQLLQKLVCSVLQLHQKHPLHSILCCMADESLMALPAGDVHHAAAAAEAGVQRRPGRRGPGALLSPDPAHLQSL